MRAKILGIFAICCTMTFLGSCENGQNFPDKPFLEYRSYTLVGAEQDPNFPLEHALVELYFTDGDGDIGLEEPQPGEFNFRVGVFEKYDSGYVFAYNFSGNLQNLSDPGQQNKVLEGDIFYKVGLADVLTDTAKFEFELVDDSGKSSGIIESEPIWVNF